MNGKSIISIILTVTLSLSVSARQKVGVVFGGGGAKGAAEVGVLKVIEEAGIPVDYVAGTSVGAIVGSLYAAGYSAAELDTLFCSQEWLTLLTDHNEELSLQPYVVRNGVTYIFGFPLFQSGETVLGVMTGNKIVQLIDSLTSQRGATTFHNLEKHFSCVATDLKTVSEVVIDEGNVAQAVRASLAIPGVFKPVRRGDELLIDGGVMNNLPVDVVRQMGADIVIAIDLQQDTPPQRQANGQADSHRLQGKGDALKYLELLDIPMISGIVNWASNRPDQQKYWDNVRAADIVIRPSLPDYDASNFGNENARRMIDIGERDARKHWDQLIRLFRRP